MKYTELASCSNILKNNAGGYSFELNSQKKLDRFLILGTEKGSYYETKERLTIENANNVIDMIKNGQGIEVIMKLLEVSEKGLARKYQPTLFVLALVLTFGAKEDKRYIVDNKIVNRVCRIGTHLFILADYIKDMRGWGTIIKEIFTNWYLEKSVNKLAYQIIKYQQREGWSHRDLLRLNHIKPQTQSQDMLFHYVVNKKNIKEYKNNESISISNFEDLKIIEGFELAKKEVKIEKIIELIEKYKLTREMIPTEFLNKASVQKALVPNIGLIGLIRNLGAFTASGLIVEYDFEIVNIIKDRIMNEEEIKKSKIHPLQILDALVIYERGRGLKGSLSWKPVQKIIDALNKSFYMAFGNVQSTGKNIYLAIDVSGSMGWTTIAGSSLTPRVASAALALVTANVEKSYVIKAFSDHMVDLNISPEMRLADVLKIVDKCRMGGTDCALPMLDAIKNNAKNFDGFIVYTDSETWFRKIHPFDAIKKYRNFSKKNEAKLITVGMVANQFSIANPKDKDMLDVVGFSTGTPHVISEFLLNKI